MNHKCFVRKRGKVWAIYCIDTGAAVALRFTFEHAIDAAICHYEGEAVSWWLSL